VERGRYGQGQILGVDDLLVVQAESGDVALVAATPAAYRELGSFSAWA
jgi:outer membrane protein assembly factor BamB